MGEGRIWWLFVCLCWLTGCVDQNFLTQEQMETQNRADSVVAAVLFEHEMDDAASYNVHKDGFLVIKFDDAVPPEEYTKVVETLRSDPRISGVRAEQSGKEACPLKGFR